MPRNGSGVYTPPPSNPVSPGTVIESEWANDTIADISNALTNSVSYDGQTVPIANLPMGGFHHLNVSDATLRNQYASFGQVQDGRHTRLTGVTGIDNILATLPGGATSYVAGAFISFFASAPNTGPMTINYNGIGAKSLVTDEGAPLAAGAFLAGDFVVAYYDGTVFRVLSAVRSAVPPETFQLRTTGQERPADGTYDALTIATPSTINIPAGTAWIIPPGAADPTDAVEVSWLAQTIDLLYLTTSFTTTIAVDINGTIVQYAGRMIGGALRDAATIGVVEHVGGTANRVVTKPFIFGDDGYRGTDTASLLTNSLISGGLVSGNAVNLLQMDIAAGSIFMPGGSANVANSPNIFEISQQANIPFKTLAGQNLLGAQILNAPVTQYDPAGAGVVTVLPNNGDTVVHRLYYLYGSFIWVYGQIVYTSVENALSYLEYDRTKVKISTFLQDATLVAEIIAQKSAVSLSNLTQAAIVAPGKINFSIGTPGGITEAPIDGTPYGRQNAGWVSVLSAINPGIQNSATITGPSPTLNMVMNPYAPGTAGYTVWANAFKWFALEVTNPDDTAYLRSYNPADGSLRHTLAYNLATGELGMDGNKLMRGPNVAVVDHVPQFATVGGDVLKDGLPVQANTQDLTAGALLRQGAFGLGNGIILPASVDLNTVVNSGFYRIAATPLNGPITDNIEFGQLIVSHGGDTIIQMVFSFIEKTVWTRIGNPPEAGGGGAWGAWNPMLLSMILPAAQDLNSVRNPGFYYVPTTATNTPVAGAQGFLIVEGSDPAGNAKQTFVQGSTGNFLHFERVFTLLTWFAWNRIPDITGAGRLAVVAALPGSPAADTIYFVT